jgi:hypothetical protein
MPLGSDVEDELSCLVEVSPGGAARVVACRATSGEKVKQLLIRHNLQTKGAMNE